MKHILITGGAGFIGSHLSERLLGLGFKVSVLDDLSTGRRDNIEHLIGHENFDFHLGSIFDYRTLDKLVGECDFVYHLASTVGVQLIVKETLRTIETIVRGTEIMLNLCEKHKVPMLLTSTSEVYGKNEKTPFSENDDTVLGATTKNRWCYAAAKIVDEFLTLAYHREKGLPVIIVRLFNTVGPRQTGQYGMVVPRFVGQALRGEPLTVYGDGEQTRCFCDVSDVVDALIGLSQNPKAVGEIYNIGSSNQITIEGLANKVIEAVKGRKGTASEIKRLAYEEVFSAGFEEIRHRRPDTTKIETLLGWKPKYTLQDTIHRIIDDLLKEKKEKPILANEVVVNA